MLLWQCRNMALFSGYLCCILQMGRLDLQLTLNGSAKQIHDTHTHTHISICMHLYLYLSTKAEVIFLTAVSFFWTTWNCLIFFVQYHNKGINTLFECHYKSHHTSLFILCKIPPPYHSPTSKDKWCSEITVPVWRLPVIISYPHVSYANYY